METTLKAKIKVQSVSLFLDEMAEEMGSAKRSLFQEFNPRVRSLAEIKREALVKHQITARQFNSLAYEIKGVIQAYREGVVLRIERLKRRIKGTKEKLRECTHALKTHQWKRKLNRQETLLEHLEREKKRGRASICFGSRKLFQKQFHLKENGYDTHEEWKKDWKKGRNSGFFLIGSKDESFGNQSCQLLAGRLKLRLTNRMAAKYGYSRIEIPIEFNYRQEVIEKAFAGKEAIHYRFVKENDTWYVHLTTDEIAGERISDARNGALGIDLNPHCIAVSHLSRDGNLLKSWQIGINLKGRRSDQIAATLGEKISKLVEYAKENRIPIVIENLDFEKKKDELRSRNLNRMLSNFSYSLFSRWIQSQAFRAGINVKLINPAYTSVIGKNKFSEGYGISTHMAAAMAIARRGLGLGECLRVKAKVRSSLPVKRNRVRHVWSDWRRLSLEAKRREKSSLRRHRSKRTRGGQSLFRPSRPTACNGPPLYDLG